MIWRSSWSSTSSASAAGRRDGRTGGGVHRSGRQPAASMLRHADAPGSVSRQQPTARPALAGDVSRLRASSSSRTAAARLSSEASRAAAGGDPGREALVVELDGDVDRADQARGERPRRPRLVGVVAAERQREADDDALGLRSRRSARARGARPLRVSGRRTGSSGVASVPVGSETATPQRAAPWSSARTARPVNRARRRSRRARSRARRRASRGRGRRPAPSCRARRRRRRRPAAAALTSAPALRRARPPPGSPTRSGSRGRRRPRRARRRENSPSWPRRRSASRAAPWGRRPRSADEHADAAEVDGGVGVDVRRAGALAQLLLELALRLATSAAASSAALSGAVRSAAAVSASRRSWRRSSATASGPVTASMRRTLAALEVSWVILRTPISAVERTCVPPHSSRDQVPSPTLDHAHHVAVLLAEQRHGAERLGLVERRRDRADRAGWRGSAR